jgi:glutamyl-tRNA reductase
MSLKQLWVMAVQVNTASAEDREQIARSVESQVPCHSDWILISTCHRVELYGLGAMPELDPRLQAKTGEDTVRHLIRVATGLDRAIVGEDEVLHQVRLALRKPGQYGHWIASNAYSKPPSPQAVMLAPGAPPPA